MLNTPTDYHTFDHVTVKKTIRENTYKWSCLIVTLLICTLFVVMWYWNEMIEAPQKFVKLDSTTRANNGSTDKSDLMDHVQEIIGEASSQGASFLTTMVNEVEDAGNQIKAGADYLGIDGDDVVNSVKDQIQQIADSTVEELEHLATEIEDELENIIVTTVDKLKDAGLEAIQSVQDEAPSNQQQ